MTPAQARIKRYRENPLAFAGEELHFEPDRWQEDFLRVLPSQDPNEKRIALQACTGPGKTAVLAVANLHFIATRGQRDKHPRGFCASINGDNLRQNLWPELSVWQQKSELLKRAFKWTATRFSSVDHPETWFLEARSWPRRADIQQLGRTLSGLHAPYVQVTLDEAGDIPVPVLQSGEQIFSSQHEWGKLLIGGNPTSHEGALHHAAVNPDLWHVIRVTGDPDDPKRSPRIPIENAREQIRKWGRDNPWVMATILGQFPPSSINSLLGIEDVQAAMERRYDRQTYQWAEKRLGVDVSRYGDDPTVLFRRQGLQAFQPHVMRHKRDSTVSVDIANRIQFEAHEWGGNVQEFLDATGGWAAGARDILVARGRTPMSVQYHAPAPDPRYYNVRAYIWWNGSLWVKEGGALPNVPELVAELTTPTYSYKDGKLLIEPKDKIRERLGRSPNHADALFQTLAVPELVIQNEPAPVPRESGDWMGV